MEWIHLSWVPSIVPGAAQGLDNWSFFLLWPYCMSTAYLMCQFHFSHTAITNGLAMEKVRPVPEPLTSCILTRLHHPRWWLDLPEPRLAHLQQQNPPLGGRAVGSEDEPWPGVWPRGRAQSTKAIMMVPFLVLRGHCLSKLCQNLRKTKLCLNLTERIKIIQSQVVVE